MSTHAIRRWWESSRTIDNPKDYNCRAGAHLYVSRAQWARFVRAVNTDQIG